jgi:SAM-dependent methyltransferase
MDHQSSGVYRILERPGIYERIQRLLGAQAARKRFSREFLRPFPGARVLDIGCGTASLLDDLPDGVDYFGFDLNPAYIDAARRRYGDRGRFYVARVGHEPESLGENTFDLVVARGIFHHLGDGDVQELLASARRHLRPGGALVSSDPSFHAGQPLLARWIISMDRGRRVRTPEAYRKLIGQHFDTVEAWLVTDLLRIPYSHYIVRAVA